MNESWLAAPIVFRFNLPGVQLFSVKVPGMFLDRHFSKLAGDPSVLSMPFERFPSGVEALWVFSHPVSSRLSRIQFQSASIRYVPSQYARRWVDLTGTFEEYARKFSSKSRSTLRRKVRRFAQLCGGKISWRTFSTPEEMEEFHRNACRISSATYQELVWNSGLPNDERFRRQMITRAMQGAVRGYILYYGARPVAFMFCRVQNGFLVDEYAGHDLYFQEYSPGVVLLYLVLQQLFGEGRFQAFDFGPGDSLHKMFYSDRAILCADICYFPRQLRFLFLIGVQSALDVFSGGVRSLLASLGLRVRAWRLAKFKSNAFRAVGTTLVRMIRNPLMDLRYGGILKGVKRSRFEAMGAVETGNTDYAVLPALFKNLVGESDVLVDVGCGKGRVINWWLSQGWSNKLIGIELDPEIAETTRSRLRKYPTVTILTGDASENIPCDATIFYLYHPFHWSVMERFKNCLLETFAGHGQVVLVYYNCMCVDMFKEDPRWEVEEIELGHPGAHPAAIIRIKAATGPIPSCGGQIPESTLAKSRG